MIIETKVLEHCLKSHFANMLKHISVTLEDENTLTVRNRDTIVFVSYDGKYFSIYSYTWIEWDGSVSSAKAYHTASCERAVKKVAECFD